MTPEFWALHRQVVSYTMTSPERLYAVRQAIHYISTARVAGAVVECGVWRGGSSMMAALAMHEVSEQRPMWLYDTFTGMTAPTEADGLHHGEDVRNIYRRLTHEGAGWARATLADVQANMAMVQFGGPVRYVAGRVEDTIPGQVPDEIALLRLDTDWYESTRHELEHLWPRVTPGGVVIIDDYGHFAGARKAVDEFFAAHPVLLSRIDYTGRMIVKR